MKKYLYSVLFLSLALVPVVGAETPGLIVSDAWVRALPPGQPNTAAYMTITNPGAVAVIITGASTEIADRAEIHWTREVDGLQRMEQLPQLQLAPGQSVTLAPGGTHLMLLGLKQMPAPGENVQLCLQLAQGAEVCATAAVRKSAAGGSSHHHQH